MKSFSPNDSKLNQKTKGNPKPQRNSTQPQPSTSGTSRKGKALDILSEDSEGSLSDEDIGEVLKEHKGSIKDVKRSGNTCCLIACVC